MEVDTVCDYCYSRKAAAACGICGARVCRIHKEEYGCAVCGGGQRTFGFD